MRVGQDRLGTDNITVRNGATLDSDTVSGASGYTHADGICVAGSGPGFGAQRSFPGLQLYWGWGGALTAGELGHVENAFVDAQLPPDSDNVSGALLIDGSNYLTDAGGSYILVEAP